MIGYGVAFVRVSLILPVSLPVAGVILAIEERFHEYVVPLVALFGMYVKALLLQVEEGLKELLNTGVGYTIIEKFWVEPGQEFATGVTETMPVIVAVVLFDAVNEGIFPVPLAASPIDPIVLAQL